MAAGSSTSHNKETVTFRLPSGEEIDAIIPGGLSDADAKSYIQMKRPDLIGAPGGIQKPQVNMQPVAEGLEADPNAHNPAGGLPGAWGNREMTGKDLVPGAIAGGTAAMIAAPTAIVPIARLAARHPIATMGAIEAARQLPGAAGKIAAKIPSWLPLLMGGKSESPVLDANGENEAFAGGEDEYRPPAQAPQEIIPPIERAAPQQQTPGGEILSKMKPYYEKLEAEGHGEEPPPEEETHQTILNQDLTPALKKSLAQVRAAKKAKQ